MKNENTKIMFNIILKDKKSLKITLNISTTWYIFVLNY